MQPLCIVVLQREHTQNLLEKVVLDGHGAKLMHETSALEKVSKFIYALPDFMVRHK